MRKKEDNIVFYPIKISNNNINLIKDQIFARIGFYFLLLLSRMMIFYFFYMIVRDWGVKNEKGKGLGWKKMKKVEKNEKSDIFVGAKLGKNAFLGGKGAKLG